MEVGFARDLSFGELNDSKVILIGSPNYDPRIKAFEKNLNFRMNYSGQENSISFINEKPARGELKSYK